MERMESILFEEELYLDNSTPFSGYNRNTIKNLYAMSLAMRRSRARYRSIDNFSSLPFPHQFPDVDSYSVTHMMVFLPRVNFLDSSYNWCALQLRI